MPASPLVSALEGSALSLTRLELAAGEQARLGPGASDLLLYAAEGTATLRLAGADHALAAGGAALVLAGEEAVLAAGDGGAVLVRAEVAEEADRHAPLGPRVPCVAPEEAGAEQATGARSFRVLLGPHNGSTRATLFLGYVPPGKAPWHYHLYDEIVWLPEGPARLHLPGEEPRELGPGAAFRLRPRQVHIVENTSPDRDL
ncbi:MAG TPA: cupin domain-containing protein, partial [Gaiellaceae bacterium]|nr:cupin domain-containing protein [Gaiellaceae bacterium]